MLCLFLSYTISLVIPLHLMILAVEPNQMLPMLPQSAALQKESYSLKQQMKHAAQTEVGDEAEAENSKESKRPKYINKSWLVKPYKRCTHQLRFTAL